VDRSAGYPVHGRKDERSVVADGACYSSRMDVPLRKENVDPGRFVVDDGCVRYVGRRDSRERFAACHFLIAPLKLKQ